MKTGLKLPVGVALFAVLALAGMMGMFAFSTAQPAGAQATETITYMENRTDTVATFSAMDPEGDAIAFWFLVETTSSCSPLRAAYWSSRSRPTSKT